MPVADYKTYCQILDRAHTGSFALPAVNAEHVHRAAERYPIYVALHTDHCLKDKLEKFVLPLVEETERRRTAGRPNLFTAHMFDGSNLSLQIALAEVAMAERVKQAVSDLRGTDQTMFAS